MAEADDRALSHFHEVQLDTGLEGTERALTGCRRHGFNPQPSTHHWSPGVGGHHHLQPSIPEPHEHVVAPGEKT